jgi:hypothetical protein
VRNLGSVWIVGRFRVSGGGKGLIPRNVFGRHRRLLLEKPLFLLYDVIALPTGIAYYSCGGIRQIGVEAIPQCLVGALGAGMTKYVRERAKRLWRVQ